MLSATLYADTCLVWHTQSTVTHIYYRIRRCSPNNPRSNGRRRISLDYLALHPPAASREAPIARASRAIELSRSGCNFVDLRWIEATSRISAPIYRGALSTGIKRGSAGVPWLRRWRAWKKGRRKRWNLNGQAVEPGSGRRAGTAATVAEG